MQGIDVFVKKYLYDGTNGMKKQTLFNMSVSEDDRRVIRELHDKHSINVSQFVRNALRELYNDLEKRGCKKQKDKGEAG